MWVAHFLQRPRMVLAFAAPQLACYRPGWPVLLANGNNWEMALDSESLFLRLRTERVICRANRNVKRDRSRAVPLFSLCQQGHRSDYRQIGSTKRLVLRL